MKLKSKFLKKCSIFPLLLIFITVLISITNYKAGTYLSGWDTLHPEFDFGLYFKRILSVWQEHQGLGAVAAQAHAAELPRAILMYFLSLFLPLSFLRYAYFFITLIIGPLGIYFFVKEFISKKNDFVAFVSSLFYLLNLATLQQYTVPLEMFATLYGFIGWIFLFATRLIRKYKKRDLWLFILVTVLSSPMAHTPTLFYIFFACLLVYLFTDAFFLRKLKQAFLLTGLIFALNSYWILPNLYFIANYGSSVADSKIHSQFSDRAFQVGKNFGDLDDIAIMKNFLFDWGKYNQFSGSFVHLLDVWSKHLSNFSIQLIATSIFIFIIFGVGISILKKDILGLSLLPVFTLSFFFLANDNFIFKYLAEFLSKFLVVKEALRFPFTKFSIILLFSYSVYFAYVLKFLFPKFTKILLIIPIALVIYSSPYFSGNLINSKMRVNIPNYYFEVFNFFKSQSEDGRIAFFPIHTFWGWSYYTWGYEGAGFLWFGLKQPLLNREFDRWHPANEQFYWESSYAVYKEDLKLLESVLDKYQVKWLLLDYAITDASSAKSPYLNQINKLIKKSQKVKQIKKFNTVEIYQINNPTVSKDFLAAGKLPEIGPKFKWADIDTPFLKYGHYISEETGDIYYPFRSLFTNHTNIKLDFELKENENSLIFSRKIPEKIKDYKVSIPNSSKIVWFDDKNLDSSGAFLPKVSLVGQILTVEVPKVKGYFSYQINPNQELKNKQMKNCDFLRLSVGDNSGQIKNTQVGDLVRLESKLANNCTASFNLNNLSHNLAYLIEFQARNIKNKSLLFWLENKDSRKADIESYLPQIKNLTKFYFIQPPMDPYGTGYTLHFDNWSFNKNYSVNDLGKISVYPLPYDFLINISLINQNQSSAKLKNIKTFHPLPYLYIAKLDGTEDNLILYQSYDPGWYAFGASKHFLVNNWANGWKVNANGTVVIVFLPQLLQFLGFGILILTLSGILSKYQYQL